jgi:glycosyltransferase involved in cell wall biosynthesis
MKIVYDYQILCNQRYGGVSRYFYEIVSRISKEPTCKVDFPVLFSNNYYFEKYFDRKSIEKYRYRSTKLVNTLNKLNIKRMNKNKYDIIHPTYYDPYIINKFSGKLVLTVYDMIHEIYPDEFSKRDKTVEYKRNMILAADKIIAISESTKRDILKFYPQIDPMKISVIYLGNSLTTINNISKIEFPKKYILFVGRRETYKNFNSFVKAFAKVSNDRNNLHLVCAGGGKFNDEELALLKELGIGERVKQQFFSDDELAQAYSSAVCFVFPSKYEGFGIPVLEAFACQCPTLLSNRSSLPEVGGNAALYFDPDDLDDMANQMERVIDDKELCNQLIGLGLERLKLFNWDRIAGQTLELYKSIL